MPKIDICIPCYHYGHFLGDCLDSVLAQATKDLRILVIDDASTDNSVAVARHYAERHPCIEVLAHAVNHGHIRTYNEGIAWARSDYLLLLSADDLLVPGALDRAIAVMDRHPEIALVYGLAHDLFPDQPLPPMPDPQAQPQWRIETGIDFIARLCRDPVNPVATPTAVVRTAAQQSVGGYRPELTHSGDMEMWLRLASRGAVASTPMLQGIKRVHGRNMSVMSSDVILRDYQQRAEAFQSFFRNEGHGLDNAPFLHRLALRRLAQQAFWTAMAQSARGRWGTARRLLRLVHEFDPSTPFLPLLAALMRMHRPDKRFVALVRDVLGHRDPAG